MWKLHMIFNLLLFSITLYWQGWQLSVREANMLEWVHVLCIICMYACMCTLCVPLFWGYVTVAKSVSGFTETSGELECTHTHARMHARAHTHTQHTHTHTHTDIRGIRTSHTAMTGFFVFVCFALFVFHSLLSPTNVANGSPKMCGDSDMPELVPLLLPLFGVMLQWQDQWLHRNIRKFWHSGVGPLQRLPAKTDLPDSSHQVRVGDCCAKCLRSVEQGAFRHALKQRRAMLWFKTRSDLGWFCTLQIL